ncbi:hypothetical protein QM012_000535 [Aureobasidium pullulans]|uniref:P-loop containing nucleoside triphosphate hydrolase protein n=1 Tax=Aureobasidium pullulans TaxID=5580 RepID=A0ABR0TX07_AURPU
MQDTDPYEWSTAKVVDFLKQNQFTNLAQQWSDNGLDGRMLLEDVTVPLLKDDLGIVGLKERMLIMQTIRALRQSSAAYTRVLQSTSLPSSLLLPGPQPSATPSSIQSIGSRIREGEELVEDSGGRKRRRLNLETTLPDTQPGASQSLVVTENPSSQPRKYPIFSGFLHDKKHAVDDIFYGDTAYGTEVKHNETEDDECYDNFTIFGNSEFLGNASFVYRCLQRMFQQGDPQPITYHQNSASAIYPYSEQLLEDKDARSVTIFEPSENGIKVIREKAQMLSFQQHERVNMQMSPGEFGYLLDRYKGTDEILPAYGDSDYASDSTDEQNANIEDSDSGSDNDMAEEDSAVEAFVLSQEVVDSLVEQIINQQRQAWQDKQLPKLDKNKGRSVWRLAKGSMQKARALIEAADKRIRQLADRLARLKKNLMDRTFESEQDVKQACLALEPTIHDTLHEEWKIRIWNLKVEPATTRQPKLLSKSRHNISAVHGEEASENDMQDFIVSDEDFEDARERSPPDGHDSTHGLGEQESPSELVAQHEMMIFSKDNNDIIATVDENIPDATEVPADFEEEISRAGSLESELPEQLTQMNQTSDSIQTPKKDRFTAGLQFEQESPGLPSLETLFRSRPSTTRKQAPVIEITSSPVRPTLAHTTTQSSPLQRLDIKQEQTMHAEITYSEDPDNDSLKQIRSWTYEGLEEEQDRRRMMFKLASTMDDERLESLARLFTGNMTACLAKIRAAISATNKRSKIIDGYDKRDLEVMLDAARIYLGYLYIDHRYFDSDISKFASFEHEWPWDGEEEFYATDLRQWHEYTWRALKRIKKSLSAKEHELVIIDSDDETKNAKSGHSSTRKKTVKRDHDAARKRAKAAERAAKYESQHQYSQTGSFMAGGDEVNEVPLYAPDDVDLSKHVYLNPAIAKRLKPHQIEGVKFMWREITTPEDEDGQGCLLAHTMGLGKTAQSLALLTAIAETVKDTRKRDALPDDLKKAKSKLRALILCPPTLMANWKQEIAIWCPNNLFNVFSLSSEISEKATRLDELKSWRHLGGIMLCGYTMFTKMINRQGGKTQAFNDAEHELVTKILLVKPHIVVADEVHSIKNDSSKTSLAVHKINTQRRIGLTGSPMSNNTAEIFALIDWVAPKFLGSKVEFKAHYQEPIEAGTYIDSTRYEVRRSLTKLAVLKQIIAPKLNRADITVLKGSLKSKVEFVLTIPLTDRQKLGYETYVKEILRGKAGEEGTTITQVKLFGWLSILQLLCNHPIIFRRKLLEPVNNKQKKGKRNNTLSVGETEAAASSPTAGPSTAAPSATDSDVPSSTAVAISNTAGAYEGSPVVDEDAAYADAHVSQYDINKAMVDALLEVVPEDDSIELSYKTLLVRKIMRLSIEAGDKVLIFSQSIPSLNFLDHMLSSIGARYGRIQGDIQQDKREKVLKLMADGNLDVLLISTRAGGLGLNIQQANRVIIFDFAFNPTWEEQAIGRAYRLGQTKPVFVYRFVAGGTFEYALYDKQLFKTGLSSRVVDKKNPMRNANKKPGDWLKAPEDVLQQDISAEAGKDEHVMDKIIASQHGGQYEFIRGIKTMETLMGESKDEALTAEEMAEVENDVMKARTRKLAGGPPATATSQADNVSGPQGQAGLASSSPAPSGRVVTRY